MYEMLTGLPPFYTKDRDKLFERIRKGDLQYPSYLSAEARNLLESLLARDPLQRLGSGPTGAMEIKTHAFFAGTDWLAVEQRRYIPPFRPSLAADTDVQYFDREFVSLPVINSLEFSGRAPSTDTVHFEGFTYKGDSKLS
jgi:protein-serine/threonine kinase